MKKLKIKIYILLAILTLPCQIMASPDVNPNDSLIDTSLSVHEGLEIIRASGCLPSYINGDEIKTERAIAKLLVESKLCLEDKLEDGKELNLAWQTWLKLEEQFKRAYEIEDPEGELIGRSWKDHYIKLPELSLKYLSFTNDARPLPQVGSIDAVTSPWTAYREGVNYNSGHNTLLSAKSSFSLGEWFDVSANPTFLSSDNFTEYKVDLHSGNIKFTTGNFEFKAGRSAIYWGQGKENQVIFSGNTKPIEMAQIGSPYPFKLPWIFKHLGPFQYRLFLGLLEEDREFSYPFLLGARIMMKPLDNLEFGLTRALMFGGEGSPDYSFWEPVPELFGFRIRDGWLFNIPLKESAHETSGYANNATSADVRWRIPPLRNSEFFMEIYCEDPLDYGDFFPQDSILHPGIWIPNFSRDGSWQFLLEGTYAAEIVYTHGIFRSGFTTRERIMGTDLGTDSFQIHTKLNKILNLKTSVWGSFTYNHHKNRTADISFEKRVMLKTGLTKAFNPKLKLNIATGLQHIDHFNFTDEEKHVFLGEAGLIYQF